MKSVFSSDNFCFLNLNFSTYHYTDNRKGATLNFLAYIIKGHAKLVSDNKTIEIHQGDVFFIPKNLSYQSYWYGDSDINFLSFGFSDLNTYENTRFELQLIDCDKNIVQKILNIPTDGINVNCKSLSLFYDVMADILPHMSYSSESKSEMLVEKISHSIRQHPLLSLKKISEMCAISEPYMYSLFRKIKGTTPNQYRQKILCDMGIDLLLTTDKKVEEISNIINFSSASYFRKVLKKHTGHTPRDIRKTSVF